MKKLLSLCLLLAATALGLAPEAQAVDYYSDDSNCSDGPTYTNHGYNLTSPKCVLRTYGDYTTTQAISYWIGPGADRMFFKHTGSTAIKIDQITMQTGSPAETNDFEEFCLYRNGPDSSSWGYSRVNNPGTSTVTAGCLFRFSGDGWQILNWDRNDSATGLYVAPNDVFYLSLNNASHPDDYHYISITTSTATGGQYIRATTNDGSNPDQGDGTGAPVYYEDDFRQCTGSGQVKQGTWSPYVASSTLYLGGVSVVGVKNGTNYGSAWPADDACLYVLNSNDTVAWSRCNNHSDLSGDIRYQGAFTVTAGQVPTISSGQKVLYHWSYTCHGSEAVDNVGYLWLY